MSERGTTNLMSKLRSFARAVGGDTGLTVTSVTPNLSKRTGGDTATLSGFNFRLNGDGSAPSVTVGGVAATNVVFVDGNTLTFEIPTSLEVGTFDIEVTIDGNVGTLLQGFTYYGETLVSLSPNYGPISGGTQVKINGFNFDPTQNYRVVFGDTDATDVLVLDDKTILATTPNHAVGFVNVFLLTPTSMFSAAIFSNTIFNVADQGDNVLDELKPGFQYTLLVRGEDIRRNPGISISETLGAPPSTCSFRIDGGAPAPAGGEKIAIVDKYDDDRVLWAGTVQTIDQVYEGQTDQLAWDTKCVDFTWLANRKRPIGAWFQVSVSQIVKEIITNFCPGFTSNHVQTNLAKATIILDGSLDLVTVLNTLGQAIGGGHWYFDFDQDLHFFHVVPKSFTGGNIPPVIPVGPQPVAGYITLADGGASGVPSGTAPDAYYALRCQFVYSDGTVGALGPWSNLMRFDGERRMAISGVPIGRTVGGKTVTARRLWYHRFGKSADDTLYKVRPFCQIDDNSTTSFSTIFGTVGASISVTEIPNTGKTLAQVVGELQAAVDNNTIVAVYGPIIGISDAQRLQDMGTVPSDYVGLASIIGYGDLDSLMGTVTTPDGSNSNHPAGPAAPPTAAVSSEITNNGLFWMSCWHAYRYAWLYRDGSVSLASPSCAPVGSQYMVRGYVAVSSRIGVQPGPILNGTNDCIGRLIYFCQGVPAVPGYGESRPDPPGFPIGYGAGNPNYLMKDPDWVNMVDRGFAVIPNNADPHIHHFRASLGDDAFFGADDQADGTWAVTSAGADCPVPAGAGTECAKGEPGPTFGKGDSSFEFTPDPVPSWPNEDGPYLEDDGKPDDITDNNTDLLHEDSGSQPFHVTTDTSQIRNRIFVIGSGSTTTDKYANGSVRIYVGDITSFALAGGKLRIEDPSGKSEFAEYSGLAQEKGVPYIVLRRALSYEYSMNSVVYNHYQLDDVDSQKFIAKYELDAFGRPTDGIHEFTVVDTSLKTVWQLYMRAAAELELYSKPIITISYATRDPKSRIGKTVTVDLTHPPCQGDFLIQSTTIDQIRDEGEQLAPRYTVRASSVRYELNDLLLKILGEGGKTGASAGGLANAGSSSALTGGTVLDTSSFPQRREAWGQVTSQNLGTVTVDGAGCNPSATAGSLTLASNTEFSEQGLHTDQYESRGYYGWAHMQTTTTANNVADFILNTTPVQFLEDLFDIWFEMKTPVSLTGCGIHVGFGNVTPTGQFATNNAFISASFWSGVDSGWTVRMMTEINGGNRTLRVPMNIAIAAGTFYTIRMQSFVPQRNYRNAYVVFTINGATFTQTWLASLTGSPEAQAMPMVGGMTANGPSLGRPFMSINNITGTTTKRIGVRRIYITSSSA